jgi:hypothetical protein
MPENITQNYKTHRKLVPAFHYVASALLLVALVYAAIQVVTAFSVATVVHLLTVIALIILFWYTRAFPLGVQDRVIRLEERLRFERVLPEDLRPRIGEFTTKQLIGLRYADDAELPALARRVLDEGMTDHEEIKRQIKTWRPDHCRI